MSNTRFTASCAAGPRGSHMYCGARRSRKRPSRGKPATGIPSRNARRCRHLSSPPMQLLRPTCSRRPSPVPRARSRPRSRRQRPQDQSTALPESCRTAAAPGGQASHRDRSRRALRRGRRGRSGSCVHRKSRDARTIRRPPAAYGRSRRRFAVWMRSRCSASGAGRHRRRPRSREDRANAGTAEQVYPSRDVRQRERQQCRGVRSHPSRAAPDMQLRRLTSRRRKACGQASQSDGRDAFRASVPHGPGQRTHHTAPRNAFAHRRPICWGDRHTVRP